MLGKYLFDYRQSYQGVKIEVNIPVAEVILMRYSD